MQWDISSIMGGVPEFEFIIAPNKLDDGLNASPKRTDPDPGPSPMAIYFNQKLGWTDEKLGPKSTQWKRLAREAKPRTRGQIMDSIGQKHEGPSPLQELDPNSIIQKRRKGKNQNNKTIEESNQRDGEEAAIA